ncbi:MAG: HAMP domain-containing protein [Kofleriaceae bacterium]|nr:HAMP domain-containing protein [Kofleriaceae bacterium]
MSWKPTSLSTRITIGFMVLVATFGAISLRTVVATERLHQAIRIIHRGHLQLALVSSDLDGKQVALRNYLREELGEENSERWATKRLERLINARLTRLNRTEAILNDANVDARKMDGEDNNQLATTNRLVERVRALVDESAANYEVLLASPPISIPESASSATTTPEIGRAAVLRVLKRQQRMELELTQLTDELKKWETKRVLALSDQLEVESRKAWIYTLIFSLIAVVLGIFMAIGATVMLRPLKKLREAAGRIGSGDYTHKIPVEGPREIAELAQEFNAMGEAIEAHSRELVRTERLATAGKMAAMITHEVRNPLSSIGLNTELLEEELALLPPDRVAEGQGLCRSIITEIDRLTDITEEYLQLTRVPNPKLQEESLGRIVDSVVQFVRDQLRSRGVEINVLLDESAPTLSLDEGQIRQALLNLIRNAGDELAGRPDALVRISLSCHENHVELEVADNGEGIPDDIMDKVFEAFVSSKSSGTGLGLALTQQIIEDHGGSISVANSEGGGAVFTIVLPHQIRGITQS